MDTKDSDSVPESEPISTAPTKPSEEVKPAAPIKIYVRFGGPDFLEWLKSLPPGGKLKISRPKNMKHPRRIPRI